MKTAIVADVHVGNHQVLGGSYFSGINRRCRLVLDTLHDAIGVALDEGCENFIVAGDLFDTVRPTPQIMAAVFDIFRDFDGYIYAVLGNHSFVSEADGDHALGPLGSLPRCGVCDSPFCLDDYIGMIPYRPGPAIDWLPSAFKEAFSQCESIKKSRIVVTHLGLRDEEICKQRPWLQSVDDAVSVDFLASLCRDHNVSCVYAGNWHNERYFERTLPGKGGKGTKAIEMIQIGALCPTGWNNPGLGGYGGLEIWEPGKKRQRIEIPGPRFIDFVPDKIPEEYWPPPFAKLTSEKYDEQEIVHAIEEGRLAGFTLAPEDETSAIADAGDNVASAISSDRLVESVAEFINGMETTEDKQRVLNTVKDYLTKASG